MNKRLLDVRTMLVNFVNDSTVKTLIPLDVLAITNFFFF